MWTVLVFIVGQGRTYLNFIYLFEQSSFFNRNTWHDINKNDMKGVH